MSAAWFHAAVRTTRIASSALRLERKVAASFGADVMRLRTDAGVTRAELARAAGIDASFLARIEMGAAHPSRATSCRIAVALGADFVERLYPTTGPTIRDRHQAAIAGCLLEVRHPRWQAFAEIAVVRPSRGWIDLGVFDAAQRLVVAIEIQSELHRLEQLLRWSEAKALALPSWEGWPQLNEPTVSRLLVVRRTRTNREIAEANRALLRTALPGDPVGALESIRGLAPWPGPALLWADRDRTDPGNLRLRAFR